MRGFIVFLNFELSDPNIVLCSALIHLSHLTQYILEVIDRDGIA